MSYAELVADPSVLLHDLIAEATSGTVSGVETYVDAPFGKKAFSFDGSTYVVHPQTIPLGTSTRGVFLRFNTPLTTYGYFFGQSQAGTGNGFRARANATSGQGVLDAARIEFSNSAQVGTTVITANEWHTLVVVVPSGATTTGDVVLYLDGVPIVKAFDSSETLNSLTAELWLGSDPANSFLYTGYLNDFLVLDREPSLSEIADYHAGPVPALNYIPKILQGADPMANLTAGRQAQEPFSFDGTDVPTGTPTATLRLGATLDAEPVVITQDATDDRIYYATTTVPAGTEAGTQVRAIVSAVVKSVPIVGVIPYGTVGATTTELDKASKNLLTSVESLRPDHTAQVTGEWFYVGPNTGDTTANGATGEVGNAFSSLQECLDDAVVTDRGDTVIILADATSGTTTLDERVTVSKNQVSIRGAGRSTSIHPTSNGDALTITGNGVSIEKLQINTHTNGSGAGIHANGNDFFNLQDCWVNDTRGSGIQIDNCTNYTIRNNTFQQSGQSGQGEAIHVSAGAGESCSYGHIINNYMSDLPNDGIVLDTTGDGVIEGTTIENNRILKAGGNGVHVTDTGVTDTMIIDNAYAEVSSHVLDEGTATTIIGDVLTGSSVSVYTTAFPLPVGQVLQVHGLPHEGTYYASLVREHETSRWWDTTGYAWAADPTTIWAINEGPIALTSNGMYHTPTLGIGGSATQQLPAVAVANVHVQVRLQVGDSPSVADPVVIHQKGEWDGFRLLIDPKEGPISPSEIASQILATPANKLATSVSGEVVTDAASRTASQADVSGIGGGAGLTTLLSTTIDSVSSQDIFTLADGSPDDNAYNGHLAIIRDQADANQVSVVEITDYSASNKTLVLEDNPLFGVFPGDVILIVVKEDKGSLDISINSKQ